MGKATASMSKIIDRKNGSRRVASRVNLAGLFKARKNVRKTFLVALATPELLLSPSLARQERNVRRFSRRSRVRVRTESGSDRIIEGNGVDQVDSQDRSLPPPHAGRPRGDPGPLPVLTLLSTTKLNPIIR